MTFRDARGGILFFAGRAAFRRWPCQSCKARAMDPDTFACGKCGWSPVLRKKYPATDGEGAP